MAGTTEDDIQPVQAGPSNTGRTVQEPRAGPDTTAEPVQTPLPPQPVQARNQGVQQQQQPPAGAPFPYYTPEPETTEPPFHKQWHIAKIVLGSASLVTCAVLWAVGLVLALKYGSFRGAFEFIFVAFAAGFAVIWQIAEFLTICISRKHRGIHPGAHVGLHLIIWLLSAVAVGFLVTFVVYERDYDYDYYDYDDDYYYSCSRYYNDNVDTAACEAMLQARRDITAQADRLESTLLAFSIILLLIHFVLFVRACVETHERNKIPRTRTIYIPVPMPMSSQYGYQTLPGQPPMPLPGQEKLAGGPPPAAAGASGQQPVQPQQAHFYGYYAPGPLQPPPAAAPPQMQQIRSPSPPSGPSGSGTTGRQGSGTPARSVSPVGSERR